MSLPRVTQILRAYGLGPSLTGVPPRILEAARHRGTSVHSAIEATAAGYLVQPEDLPADASAHYDGYRHFMADSGHEAIASEVEVKHSAWRYIGHLDRVGWLRGHRYILDWKTGDSLELPPVWRQLAAYRLAWNEEHPDQAVEAVAVVQFRSDGSYRFHEPSIAERDHAAQVFLAALTLYHEQHGEETR